MAKSSAQAVVNPVGAVKNAYESGKGVAEDVRDIREKNMIVETFLGLRFLTDVTHAEDKRVSGIVGNWMRRNLHLAKNGCVMPSRSGSAPQSIQRGVGEGSAGGGGGSWD